MPSAGGFQHSKVPWTAQICRKWLRHGRGAPMHRATAVETAVETAVAAAVEMAVEMAVMTAVETAVMTA